MWQNGQERTILSGTLPMGASFVFTYVYNTPYTVYVNRPWNRTWVTGPDCTTSRPTAVEIAWVRFVRTSDALAVSWQTYVENNSHGFVLYARDLGNSSFTQLTAGLIAANGVPSVYSTKMPFVGKPGASYEFWLYEVDTSGKMTAYGPFTAIWGHYLPIAARAGP